MPGSRERAMLLLGQRGMGKTVLLLEIAELARKQEYIVASPTVVGRGMLTRILEKLIDDARGESLLEKRKITGGSVGALGFSAGLPFQRDKKAQKIFAYGLSHLGKMLTAKNKGILILIDEVVAKHLELKQLIIAYQEMVGEGHNIALIMAGLPAAIAATLNDQVLTFLNRAVKYELSPLETAEIDAYYMQAFGKLGIHISEKQRNLLAEKTQGSPYLMQLIGHYITIYANDRGGIEEKVMHTAIDRAIADFKNDICATTLAPLSDADIAVLGAMAEDEEISRTGDLAERMNVSSAYIQQYKRRLIESGIIEQRRRGEIQFALPYLKEYLRRNL